MKSTKITLICIMTALSIATVMLGGYAIPKAAFAETAPSFGDPANPSAHPIYEMIDTTLELDGLFPPIRESRAHINKALPEQPITDRRIRIGWAALSMKSPFFVGVIDGATAAARDLDIDFTWFDADQVLDKMQADIESFLARRMDGVVVNPIDRMANAMDVQKCVNAGIPTLSVGQGFPSDVPNITALIANNFMIGWEVGQMLVENMEDDQIKAAIILGRIGAASSEGRTNGMLAGIVYAQYAKMGKPFAMPEDAYYLGTQYYQEIRARGRGSFPDANLEIVSFGIGNSTQDGGLAAMEDILTGNPDINALISESDNSAEGAVMAIEARGLKPGVDIKIVSCADGMKNGLELVMNDKILVTGGQNPFDYGYNTVQFFHQILAEGYDANNMPAISNTPIAIITKNNVQQYYNPDGDYMIQDAQVWRTIDEINAQSSAGR